MSYVVVVLVSPFDEDLLAATEAVRAYSRRFNLGWDVRLTNSQRVSRMPENAWWIIGSTRGDEYVDRAMTRSPRLPLLALGEECSTECIPCCCLEEEVFGKLAALHLYQQGYRHLVSIAINSTPNHQRRIQGFHQTCEQFKHGHTHIKDPDTIISWLRVHSRSDRVGIYCPNDGQAHWVRNLLLKSDLTIAEQVGVIGTSNHRIQCLTQDPPLTSIGFPWYAMGTAGSRQLHRLMQGAPLLDPITVSPVSVITRATTQIPDARDPLVIESLTWLKNHLDASQPLKELATAMGCSTWTVCNHFRRELDSTPKKEHNRLRLEKARKLLSASPRLKIAEIAQACGFNTSDAFSLAFKSETGCSPSAWKK